MAGQAPSVLYFWRKKMKRKYDVAAYIWPAYTGDEPRTRIFWPEGCGEWQTVKEATSIYSPSAVAGSEAVTLLPVPSPVQNSCVSPDHH